MTYAGYAHQGAYWLLAAVLLAAVFVVATFRAGSQADKMRSARGLVYAWLGQNVFLAISAGFRLCLYVEVYSLTQWRVAAIIWMLLIVLGLIWTLVRILAGRLNLWLVNVNAITALAVLYVCAFLNFDGFIADFNVRHCREAGGNGVPIDIGYLKELGPEVLPALFRLDGELRGARKAKVLNTTIQDLERQLHADSKNWRGWTLRRRWLAARVFERRRMRDGGPETH
jgi:hypothetical protein